MHKIHIQQNMWDRAWNWLMKRVQCDVRLQGYKMRDVVLSRVYVIVRNNIVI